MEFIIASLETRKWHDAAEKSQVNERKDLNRVQVDDIHRPGHPLPFARDEV